MTDKHPGRPKNPLSGPAVWLDRRYPKAELRAETIKHFLKSGHSNHSRRGMLLKTIIRYCEDNHLAYTLRAAPGLGYFVTLDTITDEWPLDKYAKVAILDP